MTIPFGHDSLQLVMGYFAASLTIGKGHALLDGLLMFLLPMIIHGWGDYAESMFNYETDRAPNAELTKILFTCWILAFTAYLTGAVSALWWTLYRESDGQSGSGITAS